MGSPLLIRYQKAYDENPSSRVFAPLAEAYRKVGMLDKAQEILLKGIKLHPDYIFGYLGLAQCYAELSQFNEVYNTLTPFVQSYRDNIKLQKIYAVACLNIGQIEEALETYKYLLFLNPRDKEVAEEVKKLELSNVQNKNFETNEDEVVEEKPTQTFEIEKIASNPEEFDYDDWRQEDFTFSQNVEEGDESWAMTDSKEETLNDEKDLEIIEEEREFKVDTSLIADLDKAKETEETSDTPPMDEGPVITHTLVDLYCSQGHIEKAKEILEKILILNPQDQKTRERLDEIEALVGESPYIEEEYDDDLEDLEQSEFVQTVENTEPQGLMDYFDQKVQESESENEKFHKISKKQKLEIFLSKIKQRAKEKSQTDSGATL